MTRFNYLSCWIKRNFTYLGIICLSVHVPAQNCDCTIYEVQQNTVSPCPITYGNEVIVSSAPEFRSAINQANSTGGNMTILIADGTYQVASPTSYPYITASQLVIRSLSGNRDAVVLTGTGMFPRSSTENVLFAVGDSIVIADLTIRDCGNHGIAVSGDHLFVHNVKIQNTYEQMLKGVSAGDGADTGVVQCSLFEYTAGEGPNFYIGGIDVHEGQDWIVKDNIFRNIASPAGSLAEHAIHFWNHSSDMITERNWIINCDRGIGYGLGDSPASGGIIRNNMIYNDGSGLFDDVGIGLESCPDTKVYNNTIFIEYHNAIEYRFDTTTHVQITNNLTNKFIQSRNGGSATLTTNFTNAQSDFFEDISSGNLRLASQSIAGVVDAGTYLADVSHDLDQNIRPQGSAIDIGSYEVLQQSGCLPLIQIEDLRFQGGFVIPGSTYGVSSANYAAGIIAYNPDNHSLFLAGHNNEDAIAEFAIPSLVNSTDITQLNSATILQNFASILDNAYSGNPQNINQISGMCLIDNRLIINAVEYYDAPANNTHTTLVLENPSDISASTVSGFYALAGAAHTAGWISSIPPEWQSLLGGSFLSGNSSKYPIASRHSMGPSAFVFDPNDLVNNTVQLIPTTTLLDYSLSQPLYQDLNQYTNAYYNLIEVNGQTPSGHTFSDADAIIGSNGLWTSSSQASYGFIVPGTSTYLTIGGSGGHNSGIGYKATQDNGNLCGGPCSYNADDNYNYYWLWDVRDLVKVKEGLLDPHAVRPYAYGILNIPYQYDAYSEQSEFHEVVGGTYDPLAGLLYLTVYDGGTPANSRYGRSPAIAVYKINTLLGEELRDGADNNGDGIIDEQLVNKWIGPSNGNWHHDPENWSSCHIPNGNNQVVIGAGITVTIEEGSTAQAYSIQVLGGGKLVVPSNATLTLSENNH